MKEHPPTSPRPGSSKVHKERLKSFWSSRQIKMFGLAEVGPLAVGLILVLTLFSYVYFLVPARSRLSAAQRKQQITSNATSRKKSFMTVGTRKRR
jgi:hypothetical protein